MRLSPALVTAILNFLKTAATGPLDTATLNLFTNSPDFNDPALADTDFTAPTFTGYTAPTITWALRSDAAGNLYIDGGPKVFSPTDAVNLPQTIMGVWVADSAGDYQAGEYFPQPIVLERALQSMHCTAPVPLNGTQPMAPEAYVV